MPGFLLDRGEYIALDCGSAHPGELGHGGCATVRQATVLELKVCFRHMAKLGGHFRVSLLHQGKA